MEEVHDFDVAVSFAGENRRYVEAVVTDLQATGHRVFYDEDNEVEMWGRDLTEYFAELYEKRARFAVMFVSAHYAEKPWTTLERRHILARALEQRGTYVLPVRLDSTELVGLRSTIAYMDGARNTPATIAAAIRQKLGEPASTGQKRSSGRVPLDEHEAALLLGERVGVWEYTYFAWRLAEEVRAHDGAYNDLRIGFTQGGAYVRDVDLVDYVSAAVSTQKAAVKSLERMLLGPAQTHAFGVPGESGDPDLIDHLAARMTSIYRQMIDWASAMQSTACESDGAYEVVFAVADLARQPIIDYREFVERFAVDVNDMVDKVMRGESVSVTMILKLSIPDEVGDRVDRALKRFGGRLR